MVNTIIIAALTIVPPSNVRWVAAQEAVVDSSGFRVFEPNSKPYGISYGEWTVKWWEWAWSIPADNNPLLDNTGEDCNVLQSGPVWFLAGTSSGSVQRYCTIPAGKALMFPIINFATLKVGDTGETGEDLQSDVKESGDGVTSLEVTIDGTSIADLRKYRIPSPVFNGTFPMDNIYGLPEGSYLGAAEGFWIMLEPLPPGDHILYFRGTAVDVSVTSTTNFATETTYNLVVSATGASEHESIVLRGSTGSEKVHLEMHWTPNDIGSENSFVIKLMDANGQELTGATYDVILFKGDQRLDETRRLGQTAAEQKYIFDEAGSYSLRIENIDGSGASDGISIPIQVTPEFDTIVVILMALGISGVIVGSRQAGFTRATKGS